MQTSHLELATDETQIGEYMFPNAGDAGQRAVLTSKRLVILAGGSRETHPLSRIRSVRIETGRHWIAFVLFAACACVALVVAATVAIVSAGLPSTPQAASLVRQGHLGIGAAILVDLGCAWGMAWAYRGYARLAVGLESGTRTYDVPGQDAQLQGFVTQVEHAL